MSGLHIHSFGKSTVLTFWEEALNRPSFTNRLYYILQEGAGYVENGVRRYFLKDHLYLLSHRASATYFLEDPAFCHIYIDYTDDRLTGYDRVIDIGPDDCPVLRADARVFLGCVKREMRKHPGVTRFPGENERMALLLSAVLMDAAELYTPGSLTDPVIADSVTYIHRNYSRSITVTELADRAFLSKNRFTERFTAATGVSPYRYIRSYRFDLTLRILAPSTTYFQGRMS